MTGLTLNRPWMVFDLGDEMRMLSWAINRPGFVTASRIAWREVRNADLPRDLDVQTWFAGELARQRLSDSVAFLTSRDLSFYCDHSVTVGQVTARCVATVGLSNAERVGQRVDRTAQDWGTINIAVHLTTGLSQAGLIEAMSIATQARTTAILDADIQLATGPATGTGTDCIAIAAPNGAEKYAGLHTDIGAAIGAAVHAATLQGAMQWKADVLPRLQVGGGHG